MITKLENTINEFQMLTPNETVLVGLSGGADSVALLLSLKEIGYKVFACHINHQLRGEESDRDEAFCISLCENLNIKLIVEKIDVITFCKNNKLGIEEGARVLRYETFQKYCENAKIATAHSLSDSLETTLINLTRGTSLKGLCGIPPVRDNIIRPLISCTRQEIEIYLNEKQQSFITDSTNLSNDYTRNKIRNEIIPKLFDINNSLYKTYQRTIKNISRDEKTLDEIANNIFLLSKIENKFGEYYIQLILAEKSAIINRVVAKILKENGQECTTVKISSIVEILNNNGKINISKDLYASATDEKLKIYHLYVQNEFIFERELELEKEIKFKNKIIYTKTEKINNNNQIQNVNRKFAIYSLDYGKIQGKVVVRNRRNGDKIKFANKTHTTTIKTLFNSKISQENRDDVIFLADEDGVIFVEGFGIAERVAVDNITKNTLTININKGEM